MSDCNTAAHKAMRKRLLAKLRDGDPCPRCGRPMYRALAHLLDVGHVVDRAAGGTLKDGARLEHRRCNRQAGQRLTTRILTARRRAAAPPRRW